MSSPTFPKSPSELVNALKENLMILREELFEIPTKLGRRPHRVRVINTILRLLVCDDRNHGGLLYGLAEASHYPILIKKESDGQESSLKEYMNRECYSVYEGSDKGPKSMSLTVRGMILNEAQKRGLAHEDWRESHQASAILDMGVSEKTDVRFGIFCSWAMDILNYGEGFLSWLEALPGRTRN